MKRWSVVISAVSVIFGLPWLLCTSEALGYEIFVKFGSLQCTGSDPQYEGWCEAFAYEEALANSADLTVGGKVSFDDVLITKPLDGASTELRSHCASGRHLPEVQIVFRGAGGSPGVFFEVRLTDVVVTGVSMTADSGETVPRERISLNFGEVQWIYTPFNEDGSAGASLETGWNVLENTRL